MRGNARSLRVTNRSRVSFFKVVSEFQNIPYLGECRNRFLSGNSIVLPTPSPLRKSFTYFVWKQSTTGSTTPYGIPVFDDPSSSLVEISGIARTSRWHSGSSHWRPWIAVRMSQYEVTLGDIDLQRIFVPNQSQEVHSMVNSSST